MKNWLKETKENIQKLSKTQDIIGSRRAFGTPVLGRIIHGKN